LLIRRAGTIMGMYTDWGNLKIVSCRAWLEGRTRQLNVCTGGMDALGASILTLSATVSGVGLRCTGSGPALNWAMPECSGILVSAFDSEAAGEFA
jgi:hypothetical protein